jgi:hypothetical protein
MMSLDCHQVGLLQPGNEEQIPLYACLADGSRNVLTRNLRTSAYELYCARSSVKRKLSVLYIGVIIFLFLNIYVLPTLIPIPLPLPILSVYILPVWIILGPTLLNLLARTKNLLAWMKNFLARMKNHLARMKFYQALHIPQPETNAQMPSHLPIHYKDTFSRKARVHFLGVWFVTTSKTSVQAFAS